MRVKLVKNDEIQTVCVLYDLGVERVLPRQEKLRHHKVGQQNVRRIVCNLLPLFLTFLAGVAPHDRFQFARKTGLGDKLLDLLKLAICQRVHRINDDGAGPAWLPSLSRTDDRIDYWHEEAERFARAGSGCNDIALTGSSFCDGLCLVAMKPQGRLPKTEYFSGRVVQITRVDQIVDCAPLKVSRIEREQSIRPEASSIVLAIKFRFQVRRSNSAEGPRETGVGID